MQFPDTMPAKSNRWATYVPGRRPEFKVHSNEGLAHSAIGNKYPVQECAKYELVDGVWNKVWEYVYPNTCSCGRDYDTACIEIRTNGMAYHRQRYHLPYIFQGKAMDQPVICAMCYATSQRAHRDAIKQDRDRREFERLNQIYGSK